MKQFVNLSYILELKRLKQLAKQALLDYDLEIAELQILTHGENTTFKVKTKANKFCQSSNEFDTYVLRIYSHNKHNPAAIQSELIWLTSLLRHTDLIVPKPIPNQNNSLLTIATASEIPEPRYCVLFQWLPGSFVKTKFSNETMKQIGEFLARSHNHSQQFKPPQGFERPIWDEDGLLGSFPIDLLIESEAFSQQDRKVLNSAALKIREYFAKLIQDDESFGLIHGDLHFDNCKFYRNKIQVFDFDDCGWGYYLYDLAVSLYYLREQDNFDTLQTSLFEGYQAVRLLPKQYEFYLEAMMAARCLHLMRDLFLCQDNPKLKAIIPIFVNLTIEQMNQFLEKSP